MRKDEKGPLASLREYERGPWTGMKKIAIHLEPNNLTDKDIEEVVGQLTFNSMKSDLAKFEPVSVKWRKGFSFLCEKAMWEIPYTTS